MSMSPREVVREAVEFRRPPYVPWSFRFTREAREKLEAHYGTREIDPHIGNHILELGSDIGFFTELGNDRFRDVFGVVWDRTMPYGTPEDVRGEVRRMRGLGREGGYILPQ
jgi:uroporphyrinogen decarboxylase